MWKIIPNTFNKYECNELGEIKRTTEYVRNNVDNGKRLIGLKPLKPKTKKNGYLEVSLTLPIGSKSFYVHRLIAETFIGTIPLNYAVNHKNGIKSDNNVNNLEIVTYSENSKHSYYILNNKIRPKSGEEHPLAKLNNKIVLEIRNYRLTNSLKDTCVKFNNIPKSTICKILYKRTWKNI